MSVKQTPFMVIFLKGILRFYKIFISPLLGPRCRFFPSCSDYARDALSLYGLSKGAFLTLKRLLRCHPYGGSGYDPLPSFLKHPSKRKMLEDF